MAMKAPYTDIQIREIEGRKEVLDPVRRRWVALTPEEWVRQHTIIFLHEHLGYPLELMQVEAAITLNGLTRRCDIVIYDKKVRPWMIVECKKEDIPLTQKVIDQACRYNLVLQVPYLLLTNGHQQLCLHVDTETKKLTQIQLPKHN